MEAVILTDTRVSFIQKTYLHLLGAITLFIGLEYYFFNLSHIAEFVFNEVFLRFNWLAIIIPATVASWISSRFAFQVTSKNLQYIGLLLYTIIEAFIFIPLLILVLQAGASHILLQAAIITSTGFLVLTGIVFFSKKDFSFLRSTLIFGGIIIAALICINGFIGLDLGVWFSVGLVGFSGISILYDTSNILHHYDDDQYVGASLQLFASVMLMLWYVIRLLLKLNKK